MRFIYALNVYVELADASIVVFVTHSNGTDSDVKI